MAWLIDSLDKPTLRERFTNLPERNGQWWAVFFWLIFLNLLDMTITQHVVLSHGATELNPIMSLTMNHGIEWAYVLKFIGLSTAGIVLNRFCIISLLIPYILVNIYHMLNLILA